MAPTRVRRGRRRNKKTLKYRGGSRPAPPIVCQCSSKCTNSVTKGQTFCKFHEQNGCPIKSPLTGYEPEYSPGDYNNDKAIQHSHNCFAYSMDVRDLKRIESCRKKKDCHFHVPGKTKNHPDFSGKMGKTCSDIIGRTMADVPKGYLTDFTSKCEPGFSKIGMVADEENDLHYYRQDNNGNWSHKPGGRPVTNKDAAGSSIYRPDLASRYYPSESPGDSGLNYDSFCSYMCVPRKGNMANNPIQIAGRRTRKRSRK